MIFKKTDHTKCLWGCGQCRTLVYYWWKCKTLKNSLAVLKTLNMHLPYNLAIPPLGKESICSYKDLYVNVYISFICYSPTVETVYMSVYRWTDKQNVVFLYHGILLISKKEWTFDTCYNIDGSKIYHVKWQKPDWNGYILCGWIYIPFNKMQTNL